MVTCTAHRATSASRCFPLSAMESAAWAASCWKWFWAPKGPLLHVCAVFSGEVDREHDSFLRTRVVSEGFKSVWHPPIWRTTTSRVVWAASCWKCVFLHPKGPCCTCAVVSGEVDLEHDSFLRTRVVSEGFKSVWHPPIW